MTDQFVFELQFKGKPDGSDYKENQFVIIDGSSMAEFSRLKEDLGMCMPEPFTVQYIDDEDDVISIDTEEEFHEFAKIAKKRSSRGMLMRLILNSTLPMDHGQFVSPPSAREPFEIIDSSGNSASTSHRQRHRFQELKEKIKAELKKEILSELKEMGPSNVQASAVVVDRSITDVAAGVSKESGPIERMEEEVKEADYVEDSDGNLWYLPEKNIRKTKLMHYQKKLEKKEKLVEAKIDQRLEKLEMKRKKLMEKYTSHKMLSRKPALDTKSAPVIYSAIVTKDTRECKRVSPGKTFTHMWTVVNDGTVMLNKVELRHIWSTPGLEPEETAYKLPALMPGQQCPVPVKFRAPCWYSSSFISYWYFYRLEDNQWQEFGHYVALTGSTKSGESKIFESNKKAKHDGKKVVTFMEAVDAAAAVTEAPRETQKEEKVLNEESNITLKKQMEQLQATLASSEIAAEMAREAARLLAMASASEGNTASAPGLAAPKPSEGDKLNNCGLEEAAAGVQKLNLVDSESDTDANMETNEESDRGFVIVNMSTATEQTGDDNKRSSTEDGKTVPSTDQEEAQSRPQVAVPSPPKSFPYLLEPTGSYPVFPPPLPRVANPPVYMPHMPQTMYQPVVFPPTQNPSSHGIVFPPPVNYSQIPTYPPIPTFHHPPAVPIPLVPVSSPMAAQQGQNLPHMSSPFCPQQASHKFWNHIATLGHTARSDAPATADKPAESEAAAQEMNTEDNSVANAPSDQASEPEQQQQPQPTQQPQQMQQEQPLQQQEPQQQGETTTQTGEQKKSGDQVQILPQALVDGAINVAATAYSTAWNALNNLRPKEGEASEFDPVFENNMAMLVEMGFNNLERNARLLKRFNNDISQVIGVICSTGGGCHNLDID